MPIHILPSDLSSQISSGEIIERPASVIKELLENSIDASAKNIYIDIENNGFQSIILRDDGCGINKNELLLAITHHATSKINLLSDLDHINTFGFRGEALASIRAISRLTLISCDHLDGVGWKIYSEDCMNDKEMFVQPIAHPRGTTVIVENLFYNIPVRLKFLKNQKLEFLKLCTVVKKIALAHFDINFSLRHNNKVILQYHSIKDKNDKHTRLKDVLSSIDVNHILQIQSKIDDYSVFGWISYPRFFPISKNIQYCYVNNRYVHNNVMLHAIRSAYLQVESDKNIFFILYLTVPKHKIDINIHPTKNEIQFHNCGKIHAFLYESISFHLKKRKNQYSSICLCDSNYIDIYIKKDFSDFKSFYSKIFRSISSYLLKKHVLSEAQKIINKKHDVFVYDSSWKTHQFLLGQLLIVVRKYYGLIYCNDNFSLISFPLSQRMIRKEKFQINIKKKIIPDCFVTNIKICLTDLEYKILYKNKKVLMQVGFHLIFKNNCIVLNSIPCFFKKKKMDILISEFFLFVFLKKSVLISDVIHWFDIHIFVDVKQSSYIDGISILMELEKYCPVLINKPPSELLQKININTALCMLKI